MAPAARLTPEAFARARAFLLTRGRPLEAARLRHALGEGSAAEVLAALRADRTPDGGFRGAAGALASSVSATVAALEVLHDLSVPASDELLGGAARWLREHLHSSPGGPVWPLLLPEARAEASAARREDFRVSPRAELVARLWRWPDLLPAGLLAQLTLETRDAVLAGLDPEDARGHASAALFAQTPEVPEAHRLSVLEYLRDVLPGRVAATPEALAGGGLDPLRVAPTPASPLAPAVEDALATALAQLPTSQQEDGSWAPPWNGEDAGPGTEAAGRSVRTWEVLRVLRDWGRVELS
ncbi:hypothetical protein [Deinococcus murrayi]|uniref:hypothetical protein n=1 Tax=Deinococcus murrayi TaxID=68910 RepID=UPI00055990AE|nr:hypothetical protein [Deinococcus murrayi]